MWIIGDVHGNFKTLLDLIDKLPYDKDNLCFVGDLIDRGPQSAEVVKFVRDNGYKCILGNHEEICIKILEDSTFYKKWKNGIGKETYESYKKLERNLVDDIKWFKTLPLSLKFDNLTNKNELKLLVTHAFSLSYFPLDESNPKIKRKILWSRKVPTYNSPTYNTGYFNVFGHTALDSKVVIDKEWASIDVGCSKGGRLAAIYFPAMECIYSS